MFNFIHKFCARLCSLGSVCCTNFFHKLCVRSLFVAELKSKLHKHTCIFQKICNTKFICIFLLGCTCAMPFMLITASLGAWMTHAGISKTVIGGFIIVVTPYTFKFLWAPVIEMTRVPFLTRKIGHKKSWLLVSHIVISATLVCVGFSDPAAGLVKIAFCGVIISLFSGIYDISADSYRISICSHKENALACTYIMFGYRIGYLIASGGMLLFVDQLCVNFDFCENFINWKIGYILAGVILISVTLLIIALLPIEIHHHKHRTSGTMQWIKQSIQPSIQNFTQNHKNWIMVLLFIATYRSCDAFISNLINPFFIETGFSLTQIAVVVKTFGFFAIVLGGFIGSYLCHHFGLFRALVIAGILQMCSNFMFIVQDYYGNSETLLYVTVASENLGGGIASTVFLTYMSTLCSKQYATTQFALFSALASIDKTFISSVSGWVVDTFGWASMFATSIFLGVMPLLMLFFSDFKFPPIEEIEVIKDEAVNC